MGDTAENLARQYQITRPEVDAFAAHSFERAIAAQKSGFLAGEIAPVKNETFERAGYQPRGLKLKGEQGARRRHPCPPLPGRGAGDHPAGLRRRADRRQFLGHRRRRGGGAGRLLRLREDIRQGRRSRASSRAPPSACRRRSWASARCRRSRPCSSAPASSSPTSTASRSTRPSARRSWPARASSASTRPSSTSMAARSPSAIRSAPPACGSRSRWRASSSARSCATASPRPASAAARASRC